MLFACKVLDFRLLVAIDVVVWSNTIYAVSEGLKYAVDALEILADEAVVDCIADGLGHVAGFNEAELTSRSDGK